MSATVVVGALPAFEEATQQVVADSIKENVVQIPAVLK